MINGLATSRSLAVSALMYASTVLDRNQKHNINPITLTLFTLFAGLQTPLCFANGHPGDDFGPVVRPGSQIELGDLTQLKPLIPKDIYRIQNQVDQSDLAVFGWRTFIALNAPADEQRRGRVAGSFAGSARKNTTRLLWETYLHRSELYPANNDITAATAQGDIFKGGYALPPNSWQQPPVYQLAKLIDGTLTAVTYHNATIKSDLYHLLDQQSPAGLQQLFYPRKAGTAEPSSDWPVLLETKVNSVLWQYVDENYQYISTHDSQNRLQTPANSLILQAVWQPLQSIPLAQQHRYHISEALYYSFNGKKVTTETGHFALLGLNIAVKTNHYPSYIFSRFSHVDRFVDSQTQQSHNLYSIPLNQNTAVVAANNQHRTKAVQQVNAQVIKAMQEIPGFNAQFIWQYYQLDGIQALPLPNAPDQQLTKMGLGEYELNLMRKKYNDRGLTDPINPHLRVTVGGCQGCHTLAHQEGFDFAFIHQGNGGRGFSPTPVGNRNMRTDPATEVVAASSTVPAVTPMHSPADAAVANRPATPATVANPATEMEPSENLTAAITNDWQFIADSAQYSAHWQGYISRQKNMTLDQAKALASQDPNIDFFFLVGGSGFRLSKHGSFDIGEAVFFSGKPVVGKAIGTHMYVKKR